MRERERKKRERERERERRTREKSYLAFCLHEVECARETSNLGAINSSDIT